MRDYNKTHGSEVPAGYQPGGGVHISVVLREIAAQLGLPAPAALPAGYNLTDDHANEVH